MNIQHPTHCVIATALLLAATGCATPDTDGPQAWKIQPVLNVKHAIQSSQGYYTLGRYHDGSRAWGLAADAYRKAITIDAQNIEAYNALGVALAQSGRHAEAETVLRQAVALAPALTHVRSNLGYVLTLAGKLDEAVLELKAAVLQDRGNPTAMANLDGAVAQRDAARSTSALADATPVTQFEATAVAKVITKPAVISFSNSAESVMVSRPALAEAPALAALGVNDKPTMEWGQQPAGMAVAAPASNLSAALLPPPVPAAPTVAATGRIGEVPTLSKLEVSNGNGTAGMAARVGRWLTAQGLRASRLTDQRPYTQVQTLVQFRNGHEEAAMRVALSLPGGGKALLVPTQGLRADVRVLLGRDWAPANACLKRDDCQPVVVASVMPALMATVVAARGP